MGNNAQVGAPGASGCSGPVHGVPDLVEPVLEEVTAMLAIWCLWGLPANAWFGYLFLMLGAVFVGAGGWTLKEWFWPSKRRTPAWVRNK